MKVRKLLLAAMLCALCTGQAGALEFSIGAPDNYLFGRPTSDETIYETVEANTDKSKNTALIPPGFGAPTSYLPGNGEPLTPNLVPGALNGGGLVPATGSVTYPSVDAGDGWAGSVSYAAFTEVTSALYCPDGSLGTLSIPAIGLNVKVYEGTGDSSLAKGVGHFTGTSIWDGNVALAGHNRGANQYFGEIHTLNAGDQITLTTRLGTRTYAVTGVEKVRETDTSGTCATADNCITLYTCVRDQSAYRWCVRAAEVV